MNADQFEVMVGEALPELLITVLTAGIGMAVTSARQGGVGLKILDKFSDLARMFNRTLGNKVGEISHSILCRTADLLCSSKQRRPWGQILRKPKGCPGGNRPEVLELLCCSTVATPTSWGRATIRCFALAQIHLLRQHAKTNQIGIHSLLQQGSFVLGFNYFRGIRMKKLVFVFLALSLFLAACAVQKVPLKSGVKLSSVAVAEEVGVADEIYFVGKGAAFGVVGAVANASSADQFKNFIVENRIHIKDIVRNAFLKNLQAANRFKVDATAKNCIKLNVKIYGLNNISLLTDEYEPVLLVQAEMVDENNEVIWKGGHYVQPLGNPVAPVSMKLIKANPALLAKMLEAAAEFASQKTIEQL